MDYGVINDGNIFQKTASADPQGKIITDNYLFIFTSKNSLITEFIQ